MTIPHMALNNITLAHDIKWQYLTLHHITTLHVMSLGYDITGHYVTLPYITVNIWHYIPLDDMTFHDIAFHGLKWQDITLY
jgi:hypothetical protein